MGRCRPGQDMAAAAHDPKRKRRDTVTGIRGPAAGSVYPGSARLAATTTAGLHTQGMLTSAEPVKAFSLSEPSASATYLGSAFASLAAFSISEATTFGLET